MKKFIGNVNGKSFTTVEDFNKAVDEAIKSGETPLSITSYYKECDGQCENNGRHCCGCQCENKEVEDKGVNPTFRLLFDKIKINDSSLRDDKGNYVIPTNLDSILAEASNLDELAEKTKDEYDKYSYEVKDCNNDIDDINEEISEYRNKIDENERSIDYSKSLIADYEKNIEKHKKYIQCWEENIEHIKKQIDKSKSNLAIAANQRIDKNQKKLYYDELNKRILELKYKEYKDDKTPDKSDDEIDEGAVKDDSTIFCTEALRNNTEAYKLITDAVSGFSKYLNDIGFWKK